MTPYWIVTPHASTTTVSPANGTSRVSSCDITWFCQGNICGVTLTIIAGIVVVVTVYYMWKTFTRTQKQRWQTTGRRLSRSQDAEMGKIDIPDILEQNVHQPKPQALISEKLDLEQELKFDPEYCLDSGVSWSDVVGDMAAMEAELAPEFQLFEEVEEKNARFTVWGLEVIEEEAEEE
ncbi:uncharacterized protein [Haliotis asinina]|uniref:uncharacterized protein n=1 Tax=Haliotis asinina TaxID=109174 RepID=UPI003531CD0B